MSQRGLRNRSCKESDVFGWSRSRIPKNIGSRGRIFLSDPTPDAQLDHFYITLLNWEFLLKWYNFFWNFCWIRDFLLSTTISIDFNSQTSFPLTLCKCYSSYFMWSLQLFHYQWSFSRYTKISVCNPGTQKWSKRNLQQLQTHLLVVPICKNIWEMSLQSTKQFFLKLPTTEQTTVRISAKS